MHNLLSVPPISSAHQRISDRAFNLVALGYMLRHFHPFDRDEISKQDVTFNLQQYGSLIHDLSQGLFADIEEIVDPPTTNTKGEN